MSSKLFPANPMRSTRKSIAELIRHFESQLAHYPFCSASEAQQENVFSAAMRFEDSASSFTALDAPTSLREKDEKNEKIRLSASSSHTPEAVSDCCDSSSTDVSDDESRHGSDWEPFYGDIRVDVELTANNRVLVQDSTIVIPCGTVCGLVGRNGAGKTSILRALKRHEFGLPRNLKVRSIRQEFEPRHDVTLGQYVGGPEAQKSLGFLGFKPADCSRPLRSFSGGWRMRAQLAKIISEDPDLVLLDEPTNFLDLQAIAFIEEKVREMRRVVIVSHDRAFLDATVSRIFCLEDRRITTYEDANYSAFVAQREAALERLRRQFVAQAAERRHLQDFVDRFRYSAKRAALAQSRLKVLAKMELLVAPPREEPRMRIDFASRAARGTLLALHGVSFSYADKPVLRSVSFVVNHTTRAVIVGRNGEGKSTLLRLMGGSLAPSSGRVERSSGLVCAFFTQHHADALDNDAPAVQLVARQIAACGAGGGGSALEQSKSLEERSRAAMARFGLNVGDQKVRTLSGGQKSRLAFTLLDVQRPSLMILDEPTNHLDPEMIEALADALRRFDGAVVCVSHDIAFAEQLFTDVYVCEGGSLERFRGTVSEYKEMIKASFRSARF